MDGWWTKSSIEVASCLKTKLTWYIIVDVVSNLDKLNLVVNVVWGGEEDTDDEEKMLEGELIGFLSISTPNCIVKGLCYYREF